MAASAADSQEPVIHVNGLSRRFGRKTALEQVSLRVPRGKVFGLVGENGAGKTTLIKTLLGLLRPSGGQVRVFGLDPVADPERVLARLGYLSEDREMPGWMRVRELMRYTRAFYPGWDRAYEAQLQEWFGLDAETRVRNLSRGQRAQLGLLLALVYRPELLLLDEPSSGLDAVVRRDILGAIVRTVADEGRTVLFSSHLLDEVERVADVIAMIHQGKVVLCAPMDELKARHRRYVVRFDEPAAAPPEIPGALGWEGSGRDWQVLADTQAGNFTEAAAAHKVQILRDEAPTLEDIFVARVRVKRPALAEV